MTARAPISVVYEGEGEFRAIPRLRGECDRRFVIGMHYLFTEEEERSAKSHRHFFASVNEAWQSLPDDMASHFPSPDHLRKHALIRTGYYDVTSFVAASRAEGIRLRTYLAAISDDYAIVTVEGSVVNRYTAKSQGLRVMGKQVFQESKDKVLAYLEDLLKVEHGSLSRAQAA